MIYTIPTESPALFVAWGPPYTPSRAATFVHEMAARAVSAQEVELGKSREGRRVPMLRVCEGDRVEARRFGVWVQARQHAWEAGSSWVCEGFAEWILGSDPEAVWLRQNAEIYIVPIMDVDNTATGNGGKEALPHDYNRDWMEKPNWNEVAAAQSYLREFSREDRMDIFLDLHNPAPGDKKAFFYALPAELVNEPMLARRNQFIALATATIGEVFPMLDKPKQTGAKYHPLWKQISDAWVSMHANPHTVAACLETPWNTENSTVEGYKAVGAALAKSVQQYLSRQPAKE
jgi:murein tripeptide amidase MpaA